MNKEERDFEVVRLDFEGDGVGPMWTSNPIDLKRAYDATSIFAKTTKNVSAARIAMLGDSIVSVTVYTVDGDISAEDRLAVLSQFDTDNVTTDIDVDILKSARKIAGMGE